MAFSAKALGITKHGGRLYRYTDQSGANAALNESINPPGANWRLVSVSAVYSAVPVQAGVVVSTVAGAGAAFNTQLIKGAANAQYTNYPDQASGEHADAGGPLFGGDDAVNVNAPAGGGVITVAVSVYIEVF